MKQRKRVTGIEFIKIVRATYPNIPMVIILSVWNQLEIMNKHLLGAIRDGKEV